MTTNRFNIQNIEELKNSIYQSNLHDSVISEFAIDMDKKSLVFKAVNNIFWEAFCMTFFDVKACSLVDGNWVGANNAINGVVIENDGRGNLCLHIEMFSGTEVCIVSNEVTFSSVQLK